MKDAQLRKASPAMSKSILKREKVSTRRDHELTAKPTRARRRTVKKEETPEKRKRGRPRNCERRKREWKRKFVLASIKVEKDCPPQKGRKSHPPPGKTVDLPLPRLLTASEVKKEKPDDSDPVSSVPVKRMASLDAMAKMHVICTTERKAPSEHHRARAARAGDHRKHKSQERIQVGVKKERLDSSENVIQKQVAASHSIQQASVLKKEEISKTLSSTLRSEKPLSKRKVNPCKPRRKSSPAPKRTKAKHQPSPKSVREAEARVAEPPSASGTAEARKMVEEENAYGEGRCSVAHRCNFLSSPQILPCARLQPCSLARPPDSGAASPPRCPMHRCGRQQQIIYSSSDYGCCCPGSLMRDSCLLREGVVACPHLAARAEALCACCALHRDGRRQGCLQYLPSGKACEASPLDLSLATAGGSEAELCCRDLIFLRRAAAPHSCSSCFPDGLLLPSPRVPLLPPSATPSSSATSLPDDVAPEAKKRKFSHGWIWDGNPVEKLIWLTSESAASPRRCYPAVRHKEGDLVRERDCVLLRSGPKDTDLPYVAKVAAFWEDPEDGEMMMSLLWYYRPEHTEQGRRPGQMEDEVFASRHRDANSVACIEDRCFVLTFAEYCRYRAQLRRGEEAAPPPLAPAPPGGYPRRCRLPPCSRPPPDRVLFCRAVYDFRQKRTLKNPA